jgi:hypothetical protein
LIPDIVVFYLNSRLYGKSIMQAYDLSRKVECKTPEELNDKSGQGSWPLIITIHSGFNWRVWFI